MPFIFTLDYLTGNLALVFIKTGSSVPLPTPQYGILLAIPTTYA